MIQLPDLWPIQVPWFEEVKEATHKYGRVIAQAPTGFGKTTCISRIIAGALPFGTRIMIMVHIDELVQQVSKRLKSFGIPHSFIAAGYPTGDELVQVCSQQTLLARLEWFKPPDLIIWDEAHHIMSDSALKIVAWAGKAAIIGVTATPARTDKKKLDQVFRYMVKGPHFKTLVDGGYLVRPIVYAPPTDLDLTGLRKSASTGDWAKQGLEDAVIKSMLLGKAVEHYRRITPGTQAVVSCINLKHAQMIVDEFLAAGISAKRLDGKMTKHERQATVADYEAKNIQVLSTVSLISEGFDCPGIDTVIHCRPTLSLIFNDQLNGRGARADKERGKTHFNILDMCGNVYRHGFPDGDRHWDLHYGSEKADSNKGSDTQVRRCPQCFACWEPPERICFQCGFEVPVAERELLQVDGQLVLMTEEKRAQELFEKEQKKKALNLAMGRARTKQDFIDIAVQRNFTEPEKWGAYHFNRRMAKSAPTYKR